MAPTITDVGELKKLVKALQQASSDQETLGVLKTLKDETTITEAALRESKAGLAVGKLRSHATKGIAELAKELVKKWKSEVDKEKAAAGVSKSSKGTAPSRKASIASATSTPTVKSPSIPAKGGIAVGVRNAKSDGVKGGTGDNTRDRCIELIYDGLAADSAYPIDQLLKCARVVEETVLSDCQGTTSGYKSKIRILYVNLKDKHNLGLREAVQSGDIPAAKFARMTSQDMASEERKAADKKIEEDNFFQSLGAGEQQAETDAFQCGRCKQRKCRYRQAQTRSADEPMTTFVTCTNCNHRWKFS
ncbi:transcription elongation factor [Amylostereum chailletii]|nr:transcription elongation factor [Amylostereum chailletii]